MPDYENDEDPLITKLRLNSANFHQLINLDIFQDEVIMDKAIRSLSGLNMTCSLELKPLISELFFLQEFQGFFKTLEPEDQERFDLLISQYDFGQSRLAPQNSDFLSPTNRDTIQNLAQKFKNAFNEENIDFTRSFIDRVLETNQKSPLVSNYEMISEILLNQHNNWGPEERKESLNS